MKRFIAQTGMGDAIFALPLAMACEVEKVEAHFYTAMPELLNGLEYAKGFKVPAWPSEENLKFDGVRLKYDRYRGSYFDSYYKAHGMQTSLTAAQILAAERLRTFETRCNLPTLGHVIAGPPRLPARHKDKKASGDEGHPGEYEKRISDAHAKGFSVVAVGKNEKYTCDILADIDLTDKMTFGELVYAVRTTAYVVSQVSFLTALAGCLGTPVVYVPGVRELPEKHACHIEGVTWVKNGEGKT